MIGPFQTFQRRGGRPDFGSVSQHLIVRPIGGQPVLAQVLTNRDSPRAIWRVMVAKWVCITHLKANWNR